MKLRVTVTLALFATVSLLSFQTQNTGVVTNGNKVASSKSVVDFLRAPDITLGAKAEANFPSCFNECPGADACSYNPRTGGITCWY